MTSDPTCDWCSQVFRPQAPFQRFCCGKCLAQYSEQSGETNTTTLSALGASALADNNRGRWALSQFRPLGSVNDLPPDAVSPQAHDPCGPELPIDFEAESAVPDLGFALEVEQREAAEAKAKAEREKRAALEAELDAELALEGKRHFARRK